MGGKSYLEDWSDKFFNENNNLEDMYKNHIRKFLTYIKSVGKENCIMDITEEDLKGSVEYQYNLGNIKTTASMSNHLEAIKNFFVFLHKKRVHDNIFNRIPDYPEFKKEIEKKLNLSEKVTRLALPNDVLIQLLKYFDDEDYPKENDYLIIKLYVKLCLIAPAKRQVLANLKFNDFDSDFRWVIVNGIRINIPNSLRRDILNALQINNIKEYDGEYLFFGALYDRVYSDSVFNTPLYKVLRDIEYLDALEYKKQTYAVETIMNGAILNLVESNVNPLLIANINGVTLASIEKKIAKLDANIINDESIINDAVASLQYYQYI